MKIEKINDNQIRCTLNKSDLASRQLKISELAYGSEKARELFRDMMKQANYEFGFESEDLPLMIEAIPVSAECIVLIITKVDNPEELDTRFSRFSDSDEYNEDDFDDYDDYYDDDDDDNETINLQDDLESSENLYSEIENVGSDLMNIFNQVKDYLNKKKEQKSDNNNKNFVPLSQSVTDKDKGAKTIGDNNDKGGLIKEKDAKVSNLNPPSIIRYFSFNSLDDAEDAAIIINPIYLDNSFLFKDRKTNTYYLTILRIKTSSTNFNKICNILSEYGKKVDFNDRSIDYLREHAELLIKEHAVQILTKI